MNLKAEKALLKKELEKIDDISLLRVLRHMIVYGLKNEGRISIGQYNREMQPYWALNFLTPLGVNCL